jgi:hypothetical protein
MSQNVWATIMPFGPVTLIFYWPQVFCFGPAKGWPSFQALHLLFLDLLSLKTSIFQFYNKILDYLETTNATLLYFSGIWISFEENLCQLDTIG